eukprot:superscaffoldBa00001557_g11075
MSRCLSLARFALGFSQRTNSRLMTCARGLNSRTVSRSFTGYLQVGQQQRWSSRPRVWSSQQSCLGISQQSYYSTQEAEKVPEKEPEKEPEKQPEEEPLHTIISDTESVQGSFSKHEFQAETKKLLDIVARSLYSEKEVFIRELISNGSDALEKLRHKLITAGGETAPMEIHLQTDAAKGTFTIQDTGVGMNQEELIANLGTIARSGSKKPSMFDVSREMGSSVALYSRKVLIQTKATDILPKWLRFLRGVVDSEDIPLNLSRELLQESALIRKLRDVLQQRVIRFLLDQGKKEPEKYNKFFEDYGLFMREGIVTTHEQDVKEDIAKLLRFESSALPVGQQTSLMEYSARMKAGTRNIYYLCAPNRHLAEHSPYYEAMKQKDMEVLFCYEQFDELTLLHLREFDKKKLISAETDIVVDHYKEEKFEDSKPASERLTQEQADDLIAWMKNTLSTRVTNIKLTPRLDTHPAMITVLEMGAARHFLRTQQLARSAEERAQILQPTLEINAGHDLIKKLHALKDTNSELAGLLLEQIYDNAMITAGLNDDPRPMVSRLNDLLTKALEKH